MSNNFYTDDIQTGRNVYVDKDLYESDESYKARIDSYVKEGFALVFGTPDNPSSGEGGGGGDGYFGLHTATVNVTFDTSEIEGNITSIQDAYLELGYDPDSGSKAISLSYDDHPNTLLVTDLGSPTEMVVPTSDDYPLWFGLSSVSWRSGDNYVIASDITVVSGNATQGEYSAVITGDCSLNIKVGYQG